MDQHVKTGRWLEFERNVLEPGAYRLQHVGASIETAGTKHSIFVPMSLTALISVGKTNMLTTNLILTNKTMLDLSGHFHLRATWGRLNQYARRQHSS